MKLANKGQEAQGEGVTGKRKSNSLSRVNKIPGLVQHLSYGPCPAMFKLGMLFWGGVSRG